MESLGIGLQVQIDHLDLLYLLLGQRILTSATNRKWYEVNLNRMSYFDPRDPGSCVEYTDDMFANCVDDKVQTLVKPDIGRN